MLDPITISGWFVGTLITGGSLWYARKQYLVTKELKEISATPAMPDGPEQNSELLNSTVGPKNLYQYCQIGEHLWYLSNPPRLASADKIAEVIRGFIDLLDKSGLKATRATAEPLESLTLLYGIRTGVINDPGGSQGKKARDGADSI